MQEALRWVPLFLYEKMVDLASSGKMSSFGYSDLGEMKDPVKHFLGTSVIRMHHYPPVPSPPGFNVVLSKSEGELNFVWAYFDEALSSKEVQEMELSFRKSML